MKGELLKIETRDKLLLHGMFCPGQSNEIAIIHVHGSYGNFYENFFLDEMSENYNKSGISFLSVSTRGRDYYSDFKILKENKYESIRIGGIREIFQDSVTDIASWIDFLKNKGFKKIILQGHSLGAMKVVYYIKHADTKVNGLILLSPPDNIGLQKSDNGNKYDEYKQIAHDLSQKDLNSLMPKEAYYDTITSTSFFSLLTEEDTGMFTYSDIELMKKAGMSSIAIPTLVTFATNNEAIVNPIDICIDSLKKSIPDENLIQFSIIENANHNYHFKEKELTLVLLNWVVDKFKN